MQIPYQITPRFLKKPSPFYDTPRITKVGDNYTKYLPMYLQQADMESNGKNISKDSSEVNYNTGPILWGDVGTNGQHSFFQLIHQGTKKIPCDFIGFVNSNNEKEELHEILLSNLVGQTMALMKGSN